MDIIALIQNYPRTSIILISLIVSLFVTIINSLLVDKKRMKEIKEKQKELRAQMKLCKNDPSKMMEINKKMMEDFPEQMKTSFKPMIITIIPLLILFKWMSSTLSITAIAKTWIWWYIGASIIFSMILRKIFGLQ